MITVKDAEKMSRECITIELGRLHNDLVNKGVSPDDATQILASTVSLGIVLGKKNDN